MIEDTFILKGEVSIDDAGTVTGIAWPFGSPDSVGDVIEPGAFNLVNTLPMVMEHDQKQVVGVWETAAETDRGLEVKGRLFVEGIGPARDAHRQLKAGRVAGLSIGFRPHGFEPRAEGGRVFKSITVTEISLCQRPVHPGARVTIVKSEKGNPMEDEIENAPEAKADPVITADEMKALKARLDKIEAKANRPVAANNNHPAGENDNEVRKAFGTYLRYGGQTSPEVLKALTVSNDAQGGYLAPQELSTEFIRDLVEFSPIRSLATVRYTSAPSVAYPKRIGRTNAKWKGETQPQEESGPAFGQVEIVIREINTYVDISNQLLADAGTAEAEVRLSLAEDFGEKEGLAFVKGSTNLEPEGIMSNADVEATNSGNAATLGTNPADLLISHMYLLPAAYRARGVWLMNSSTLAAIRKLKDGTTGVYLWQPSYAAGQPETILGRPVIEVPDMDDIGAAAEPILFGDIATAYRIVDRTDLSVLVNPYIQATNGITRIHATRRTGAAVVQPKAIRKIKCAV